MAKKRGQGDGSITEVKMKNGKTKYQARLPLSYDADGKPVRKAKYFDRKQDAQQWLRESINDIDKGEYIEPTKITVAQWMDTWLNEYKKNSLKPATFRNYYSINECHIKPLIGAYKLSLLRVETVQKFVNDLGSRGLSPQTAKICHFILFSALKQAIDNNLIKKNVAEKVILPKKVKKEIKVLSPEEQQIFIESAKKVHHGEIFILTLGTGLRIGEALALTWSDIDFENAMLRVNKTQTEFKEAGKPDSKYHIEYGTPKTRSSNRIVPLLPEILTMLQNMKENQCIQSDLLFHNADGEGVYKICIQQKFKRICSKLDIDGLHFHCLRHTFATRALEQGIEMRIVQEFLGHSSINMTANLYTHVLSDKKKDSIMKM